MSRIARRLIPAAIVAALTLGVTASANAHVTVNNPFPLNHETLTATVSSPPAGATQYTLAECNVTSATPADWGRDCNQATAVNFTPVSTTSKGITVPASFTNFSFVPGLSPLHGMTTTCDSFGADPCAVVVSWYSSAFASLGAQKADLLF
jgi:hypothetical protein